MPRKKGPLRLAIEDFIETYISPVFQEWIVKRSKAVEESVAKAMKQAQAPLINLAIAKTGDTAERNPGFRRKFAPA